MRGTPARRWRSLVVLVVGLLPIIVCVVTASTAFASTGAAPANPSPLFAGIETSDGDGVPLANYQNLPLDRGSSLDGYATMTAWLTDAAWTWHVGVIALAVQLLGFVLSFEWAGWLLGPLDALRASIGTHLGAFGWAPLALVLAVLAGGIIAFRGRLGAGVMQLIVSAACFALASTVMLAPLTTITGSETPIQDAKHLGQELANAIVDDVLETAGPSPGATAGNADAVARLQTRLIDLLVREAAQEVSFGGSLDDTPCDAVFTDAMLDTPPRPGDTTVLDAVGGCDESAGESASTPSLWQPFSVFVTATGSLALFGFVAALAVGMLGTVASSALASIRAMIWVNVAILPGIGRHRFLRALADAVGALIATVILLVAVAGAAALIVSVAERAAEAGTPLTVQMACVTGVTAAAAVMMVTIGRRLRQRGHSAADALRTFVTGGGTPSPRADPIIIGAPSSSRRLTGRPISGGPAP